MLKPNKDAIKVMRATRTCVTIAQLEVANKLIQAWIEKHKVRGQFNGEVANFWGTVKFMRNVWENTNRNIFKENKRLREQKADATI